MPMLKVSFMCLHEVYAVLQANAARAGLALPVYVRDLVFQGAKIDASQVAAQPETGMPKLTQSKRAILTLLQNHKGTDYLTTRQIQAAVQCSDQAVYLALRALKADGWIERGQNLQRGGMQGAPQKTYAISDLGSRVLSDDQTRVDRAQAEFQARTQAAWQGVQPAAPKPPVDSAFKANVHASLRYIAMAMLGRAIESETDVENMRATHERLCTAADMDVTSGAHSYGQILEKVTAKIQALGGTDAIVQRFNIG